jgi:PAS domain S-box-containing protein
MTEPRSVDSHAGSNTLLSALADEGNAVVWALDDAGCCVFAGHRWVQHTGLSEAASHGSGWHAAVHPADLDALLESLFAEKEKRFLRTLRLLEYQRYALFTMRATHTGEGWLVVAHRAPSENPEHLDAFGTDEYFRVCIETLLDCFGVFTAERDSAGKIIDFRIDYLNAAACRNNGSSLEDQVGRGLLERLPGHLESGLFDAYVGLVESGRPIDRVMQFYADDYGTGARQSRWFDIRAQKLGDGFAAAWRDVTEAHGLREASRWNEATARLPGSDRIGQLAGLPTQEALQARTDKLLVTLDAITDGVLTLDRDWRYTYFSEKGARAIGMRAEELIGACVWDVFPHAEGTSFYEGYHRAVRSREPVHFEEFYPAPLDKWLECHCYPDDDGLTVYFRDVTERRRAQAQLQRNHETFRRLVQTDPFGLYLIDADFRLAEVSLGAQKVFAGVRPLIGRDFDEVLRLIWPEPFVGEALAQFRRTLATGKPYRSPATVERRADIGETEAYDWRIERLTLPDGRFGVVCHFYDLSDRLRWEAALRESEERFRTMADALPLVVWVHDKDGKQEWVNQTFCELFGVTREEMRDGRWQLLTHPQDGSAYAEAFLAAVRAQAIFHAEVRAQNADGDWICMESWGRPRFNSDGAYIGHIGVSADITERKLIHEALRDSEEFNRTVLESSPDCLKVIAADGTVLSLNENGCSLLRLADPTVLVGKKWWGFWPEESRALVQNAVVRASRGEAVRFEREGPIATGEVKWWDVEVSPVRNPDGSVSRIVAVSRDITARKKSEEAVARLAAIVESSHDALFGEDLNGIITSWNQGAEQIFGYRAEEIVGTSIMRLMPADRQAAEHELQRQIVAGELGGTFEAIRLTKEGREFPASITVAPLKDAAGKVIGTSRVLRDITERARATEALRASQERIRLAAATTGVGIWEWNVITNVIRWDSSMFGIYGIEPTPDGLVQYQDWSGAVLPEELAENEATLQDTVRRCGQSTREFRIRRRSDGECRWIQSVETVRANHEGKAEWVLGTNLDVTERLATAQALRDADRRKDEFLATLAHELRNPLAPVRTGLQVLKLTADKDIAHRTQLMMERQLGQMVRLIDDLLEVSRITSGKVVLRQERIELQATVHTAIEAVRPQLDAARQELQLTLPSEPIWLHADATRICQVVNNLLTNASKYSPDDSRITLNVRLENGKAVVTVADEGEGIPQNMLASVFEMFAQVDRTLDRAQGGLGIGLALVKRLVEMHRGTVSVESAGLGAGSTFTVRLPIAANAEALDSNVAPLEEEDSNAKLRVLVVDDNADASETLAELLSIYGHETRVADSGASALAVVREFKPGLVFLDIGMPGMNGYETAKRIRADDPSGSITLVALTGWGAEADRIKGKEAGFDHHFTKPVELDKVDRVLQLVALSQTKSASA